MISSRSRPLAGILSLISFAVSIYISSTLSGRYDPRAPFYLNLAATSIFAYNVPILLAWVSFGVLGGIAVTVLSIVAAVFFNLKMGLYGYQVFTLSFFVSATIGYIYLQIKGRLDRSYQLRLEKIDEDINLLTNSLKLRNANITALESKLDRYSLLKGVSESLSMVLGLDEVTALILKESVKTIGKKGRALLFLVDSERQELMLSAAKDESRIKMKMGDAFDHWVLRNRKSLIIEDVAKDYRFPAEHLEGAKGVFKSLIAEPLISQNKVIGILRMDNLHEYAYSQDDLRLLDILSDLGAVAVQNALLYERTQELAIRDSLTGLVVRRYFMERFHHEIRRSARKKEELSILLVDIDNFKDYNDKYGHASGDLVLKHMAGLVEELVDDADVVGRYGGEEFVILLCNKSRGQAAIEAERIRKAVKERPLTLRRQETRLTVSIGLATYPGDAVQEVELIRAADSRLYKAKSQGRDRVCSG